jgi:gliding motility-associated-like protein
MLKLKQLGIFLIFSVLLQLNIFAFSEPIITCLQVLSDGKVIINFKEPIDKTGGLISYKFYYGFNSIPSASTGTPINLAPVPAFPSPILSVTDDISDGLHNANLDPIYYRIDAVGAGGIVKSSDCISSLNIKIGTSPLKVSWDKPSPNIFNITASGFKYEISRIVNGISTDTYSTKLDFFNDFNPYCLSLTTYIVELKTNYGCSFVSNKPNEVIKGEKPDKVLVDSVSFDENNNLIISWPNIKTIDVIYSNLLFVDNPSGTASEPFDSIRPPSIPNVFNIPLAKLNAFPLFPEQKRIVFSILNRNCVGTSDSDPSVKFSPIFLDTISKPTFGKDDCTKSYKIGIYGGSEIERGVVYYKTFLKTNSEVYKFLDSIPAGSGRNNVYNYVLDSLSEGNSYKFFVRAYNQYGNATATSMRYSFSPKFLNTTEPNKFHLKSVSSNSAEEQNIAHFIYDGVIGPNARTFNRFELIRSDCGNVGTYSDQIADRNVKDAIEQVVASVNFAPGQRDYFIKDLSPKIFTQSYCYYVKAINTCNLDGGRTETHRNMALEVKAGKDVYHQNLIWNNYKGFEKGVSEYKIYRIVDFKVSTTPYKTVTPASDGNLNFFEDDIRTLTKNDARVLYYIKAIEAAGNLFGSDSASSNIDTANSSPDFFIPSAFSPNGNLENQVFKPSRFYISLQNYKFEIYNRFGQNIWSTTDPNKGWDGKEAQSDVYVYKLFFNDSEGKTRSRYGDFILIK